MNTFDRHAYLKHSTANTMTFKPAHKDTETPAGQVVNDDQGQRTLSDYIRSIKRAEAFDAVAAEKKLTFNEWFKEYFVSTYGNDWVGVLPSGHDDGADLQAAFEAGVLRGKVS